MTTTSLQLLVDELNAMCEPMPYHLGWYFKDLRSGFEADRNGHVQVPSASTRKVSILMAALKQVHEGKLRLNDPMRLRRSTRTTPRASFSTSSRASPSSFAMRWC